MSFELDSDYLPAGDQPQAIEKLVDGLTSGLAHQTLLGVTGSGKTFTIANVIQQVQRPTLVLAHNKTLAAQLYGEFKVFFPKNAVEYFVSTMTTINLRRMCRHRTPSSRRMLRSAAHRANRLSASKALLERPDHHRRHRVGDLWLGDPEAYLSMVRTCRAAIGWNSASCCGVLRTCGTRARIDATGCLSCAQRCHRHLSAIGTRSNARGVFDDQVGALSFFDPLTGEVLRKVPRLTVCLPATT